MREFLLSNSSQPIIAESEEAYKILDQLGQGGNGEVHLVIATTGQRRGLLFALKLFREIEDEIRLARFHQEITLLSEFNHPSLLKVVDNGNLEYENGTYPFVVFEYLPQTLADAFRTGITMVEKASFTLQLISGLHYLSSQNPQIVHRDIKPANIFVRGKSCILGDFGLIKVLGGDEPEGDRTFFLESVAPAMPWNYRTPDLVSYCRGDGDLTVKSDVFQLGLVIAEMFSGRSPLKKANDKLDDIELHENIYPFGGRHSNDIAARTMEMLAMSADDRPHVGDLLEPWDGIFRSLVSISIDLEGRVFPS